MITQNDLFLIKENGHRKVLRIRFMEFYGIDGIFLARTLTQGEIMDAYVHVGYPGRQIPPHAHKAKAEFENKILELSIISVPKDFQIMSCHAGIPTQLAETVLEYSGFLENTKIQDKIIQSSAEYANSVLGRGDGLILHTFPSITLYELGNMTPAEWSRKLTLAITIQVELHGEERVYSYLKILPPTTSPSQPAPTKQDPRLKIPDRVPGMSQYATEDDSKIFYGNNLSVKQGQQILDLLQKYQKP